MAKRDYIIRLISEHKKKISFNFDYKTVRVRSNSGSVVDPKPKHTGVRTTYYIYYIPKKIMYRVGIKIESQTTFIVGLSKCVIS